MSEDAGNNWTQIHSGNMVTEMECVGGVLFVSFHNTALRKYIPGSGWTDIIPKGDKYIDDIAVDPTNNNIIYAVDQNGFEDFYRSTDQGTTWTTLVTDSRSEQGRNNFRSDDIPWTANSTVREWISPGNLVIDPHNTSRMWFSEGMGMWVSNDISNTNDAPTFDNISQGIEEMVATDVAATQGNIILTTWDRSAFVKTDLTGYPTSQIGLTDEFSTGTSVEVAPGNPNFITTVISDHRYCGACNNGNGNYSGYSEDGGDTWTKFGSLSGGNNSPSKLNFGEVVVSATNTSNMVWVNRDNQNTALYYTTNKGNSWNAATVPSGYYNSSFTFLTSKKVLTSDPVVGGKFYSYAWQPGRIFSSSDGGANWDYASASPNLPTSVWHAQLKAAPGKAGHLWFATGYDHQVADPNTHGLFFSPDGGTNFSRMQDVQECWALGFGKAQSGSNYPTIFMYGLVYNEWGLYRSTNQGAGWVKLVDYPLGLFDIVTAVSGDPDIFGRVYIGYKGNSFVYGDGSAVANVPVQSVSVSPTSVSLYIGETQQLTKEVFPSNATEKTVTWSTSNSSVATVSASGLVSGVGAGSVTITATSVQNNSKKASATVTVSGNGGSGLKGSYYNGMNFETFVTTRVDSPIDFTWGEGSPISGLPVDEFSVRWEGQIEPKFSETYTFYTYSDDGARLWVNGVQLVDKWVPQGATEWSGSISLTGGQKYSIVMEFLEEGGAATARLSWSSASQAKEVVSGARLFNNTPLVNVTGVSVSPATLSLSIGATSTLSASVSPSNATNKSVTWSSNSAKVSVDQNGMVTANSAGTATITATTADGGFTATSTVTVTGSTGICTASGTILMEKYNGINGQTIADLTGASAYPASPSSTQQLTSFEIPTNVGSDYGVRVRGFICAPTSGNYTFWIAGDDHVELWLSTTNQPSNKVKIASHTAWTNAQEWNKYPSQKSASIALVAGKTYYIEALMKEASGGDNLAVGWAKPGQSTSTPSEVIPGSVLSPASGGTSTNVAVTSVSVSPNTATLQIGATTQLTATIAPSTATNKAVSWNTSNSSVATVSSSGLVTAVASGSATITATTTDGGFTSTSTITVNAAPPTGGYPFSFEGEDYASMSPGIGIAAGTSYQTFTDATASGGEYVSIPNNGSANLNAGSNLIGSHIDFSLNLPNSGNHYLWMRIKAATANDDSCIPVINGVSKGNWGTGTASNWKWVRYTLSNLSAGTQTLSIYMREDGLQIDKIEITNSSGYTPTGLGSARVSQDVIDSPSLKMYPVPSRGVMVVSGFEGTASYTVFDLNGAKIANGRTTSNSTISLNIKSGIYMAVFETENQGVIRKTLIIQP